MFTSKMCTIAALAFGIRLLNHKFEILVGLITIESGIQGFSWVLGFRDIKGKSRFRKGHFFIRDSDFF